MNDFWLYFKFGFQHVLDFTAYDHLLFLLAIVVCFDFMTLKKLIGIVTVFSIGHTVAMVLACFDVVTAPKIFVEIGIALTIALTAVHRLAYPLQKSTHRGSYFLTLFFGVIHGLGFSSYLKMLLTATENKALAIISFAVGIETVQILWVLFLLVLQTFLTRIFNIKKRDWVLVIAAIVLGMSIPMILERF